MDFEIPILCFFTDPQSGQARRMESLIAHLARTDRRVRVKRIDVSQKPLLARRLKVESLPTLLLVKDKRVVGRLEDVPADRGSRNSSSSTLPQP